MKKIVLLAFVLVLFSTAVVVGFVGIVVAGGTITIRADGSVYPATAPISSTDNVTYKFTGNINDSIVVERDNIVVDGAGYTLQGTGTAFMSVGINMTGRRNVTIKNMEIKAFFFGIYLYSSQNNIITGNNIKNNNCGIWVSGSSDNKFYHNNFINNTLQASVTTGYVNTWDNGYTSGGNYWSDYTGTDTNGDGVGDTKIPHLGLDNYPLMDPWGNPQPSYTLTIHSLPTNVTFTVDNVSHTTSWSGNYTKRALVNLVMPETHKIGDAKYNWTKWSDGITSRSRNVTMTNKDITLTANYAGPYYALNVTSSPITGITFTINGTPKTTRYTGWLLNGSYTLKMPETHDGYIWSHWLDGDPSRTKTVTMDKTISLTAVFTRDTTFPTISILSPENKTYAVRDVPLTFTVSESTSWIGYSLDGQKNKPISGNTTLVGLSDGTHTITVYANDTVGNMGHSDKVYFTVDTVPPNIEILSPENKTYAVTDVPLAFTVSESTSWVGYSLDNQASVTITGNTTLSLLNGMHYVIVYAKDTAGNMGSSSMVYFTVDSKAPSILLVSPTNAIYTSTSVPLRFVVYGPASWIGYSLDGKMKVTISGNTTLVDLFDGVHTIIVYANDTDGNMGHSDKVYFTVDTVPPNIEILSPENKTYAVTDVPLTFTVSGSTSWIGYSLDDQANNTIAGNTTLIGLSDGTHSLVVYASDILGNMGSSGMVHFTIATPLRISILSPQNKTYDTADVPLTFTVDETVSWTAYSLDGQANVTITGNIVLSGLSDGSHSIIVYAKDTAGNTGASGIVYFTIETQQVEPSQLWIVVVIAIIAGAGFAVSGYMVYDLLKASTRRESRHS